MFSKTSVDEFKTDFDFVITTDGFKDVSDNEPLTFESKSVRLQAVYDEMIDKHTTTNALN